jgi:hypothetical protein
VWRNGSRRFEGNDHLPAQGPTITLLGPSESLVRKHWHRLPLGVYVGLATFSLSLIKSITPSNQLSYVARFAAENQGILVAGGAGCVDFRPTRGKPYYTELLNALAPLHVVQVAHHAGNNAHFYRVLIAAQYSEAVTQSFLLVSHATKDRHRPSGEFRQFVEDLRREPDIVSVLFTAQPRTDKVRDFEDLVHATVGHRAQQGDARLEFREGTWRVTKHAIAISQQRTQVNAETTDQPTMALERDLPIKPPITLVGPEIVGLRKLSEEDRARKLNEIAAETLTEPPSAFVENAEKRVRLYILYDFEGELKSEEQELVKTLYSRVADLQRRAKP